MTFAIIRAHLKTHPTINSFVAGRLLGMSSELASNELCRWLRRGHLVRVRRGVYRDAGRPHRQYHGKRVFEFLRDHGVSSPRRVSEMLGIPTRRAVDACCDLVRNGKARRVSRGIYVLKEMP